MSGPQTEKARLPNWVRVLCIAAALVEMVKMKSSKQRSLKKQETQLSLTNRATRLEVSQGRQTIRYVRHGFLLVYYSNFVPKTRLFLDIRIRKMS